MTTLLPAWRRFVNHDARRRPQAEHGGFAELRGAGREGQPGWLQFEGESIR